MRARQPSRTALSCIWIGAFLASSVLLTLGSACPSLETCNADDPMIRFTFVPEIGSGDWLRGHVCHVDYSQHAVAVFIRVNGGWWTKPYWSTPLTPIGYDGSWTCDVVTGGIDQMASKIAAFLVPADYAAPSMSGQNTLPDSLYDDALAHVEVDRD